MLGSSLQSNVFVQVPDIQTQKVLESYADELESMFVVSSAAINTKPPLETEWTYTREFEVGGIKGAVVVLPPKHAKCPRCWRYVSPKEDSLCGRCEDVVAS